MYQWQKSITGYKSQAFLPVNVCSNFTPPLTTSQIGFLWLKQAQDKAEIKVRGVGFEPTNPYGIAASGLRLWPCLATPALSISFYLLIYGLKLNLAFTS